MEKQNTEFRPDILVWGAWAQMQSEELSAKKCWERGVGGLRRRLSAKLVDWPDGAYSPPARLTLAMLEDHCTACGKCRWRK